MVLANANKIASAPRLLEWPGRSIAVQRLSLLRIDPELSVGAGRSRNQRAQLTSPLCEARLAACPNLFPTAAGRDPSWSSGAGTRDRDAPGT
jgi:hypothetical protein